MMRNADHMPCGPLAATARRSAICGQGIILTGPGFAAAAEPRIAMHADAQQETQAEHYREHSGAAVGDQRQWQSYDRNEARNHCGVDEHIEREIGRNTESQ